MHQLFFFYWDLRSHIAFDWIPVSAFKILPLVFVGVASWFLDISLSHAYYDYYDRLIPFDLLTQRSHVKHFILYMVLIMFVKFLCDNWSHLSLKLKKKNVWDHNTQVQIWTQSMFNGPLSSYSYEIQQINLPSIK